MKINTELLKAVQEQEIKKTKPKEQNKQEFEQVLNQNLSPEQDSGKDQKSSPKISGSTQMAALQTQMQTNSISSTGSQSQTSIREKIDQVLSKWENYSQQLQAGDSSLKNSFSTLEEIRENISQLQTEISEDSNQDQGIKSILNELEIMAVTEQVKFNRGDYH